MLELQFTKQKRTIKAEKGETIRETAIRNKLRIYPHIFKILNCRGRGLCHSCAIKIVSGKAEPKNEIENHLEQLRALDNNITIMVALAKSSPIGIDTKEDYIAIKKIMEYKS